MDNMECRQCGFTGDDVQDFVSTDEPSERLCPECGSEECYIVCELITTREPD